LGVPKTFRASVPKPSINLSARPNFRQQGADTFL